MKMGWRLGLLFILCVCAAVMMSWTAMAETKGQSGNNLTWVLSAQEVIPSQDDSQETRWVGIWKAWSIYFSDTKELTFNTSGLKDTAISVDRDGFARVWDNDMFFELPWTIRNGAFKTDLTDDTLVYLESGYELGKDVIHMALIDPNTNKVKNIITFVKEPGNGISEPVRAFIGTWKACNIYIQSTHTLLEKSEMQSLATSSMLLNSNGRYRWVNFVKGYATSICDWSFKDNELVVDGRTDDVLICPTGHLMLYLDKGTWMLYEKADKDQLPDFRNYIGLWMVDHAVVNRGGASFTIDRTFLGALADAELDITPDGGIATNTSRAGLINDKWELVNGAFSANKMEALSMNSAGELILDLGNNARLVFSRKPDDVTPTKADTLYLPNGLRAIEAEAFSNLPMQHAVIPDNCVSIGERAFSNCDKLTVVEMPNSINAIADNAFDGCSRLVFVCESKNRAYDYAVAHGIPCIICE